MSKIDHIDYEGERYPFVDQTARDANTNLSGRVDRLNKAQQDALTAEIQRATNAEEALNAVMLKKEPGKGLSTNDFTDDYKNRVDNIRPMTGASEEADGDEGYVPAPKMGDEGKYLDGSGHWTMPPVPEYDPVTHEKNGLMTTADKIKLDAMDQEIDDVVGCTTTPTENGFVQTFATGKVATITFNADGSIDKRITQTGRATINLHTVFNEDGSVVRTRS